MQDIINRQQDLIDGKDVDSGNFLNISGLIYSIPNGQTRTINGVQVHRSLIGDFSINGQILSDQQVISRLWDAQS